jgi:hypothetical protein
MTAALIDHAEHNYGLRPSGHSAIITRASSLPPPSKLEAVCRRWLNDENEKDREQYGSKWARDGYGDAVKLLPRVRASIAEINGLVLIDDIIGHKNADLLGEFMSAAYNYCADEEVAVYDLEVPIPRLGGKFIGILVNRGIVKHWFGNDTRLLINVGEIDGVGFGNNSNGVVINAGSAQGEQGVGKEGILIDISGGMLEKRYSYENMPGRYVVLSSSRKNTPGLLYNNSPELESYVMRLVDCAKEDPWSIPEKFGDMESIIATIKGMVRK